ncbi:glycerophosphoryl diester phosphodiesterase, partial [Thraustotheca clavata]
MVLSWWSFAVLIAWGVVTLPLLQLTNFHVNNAVYLVPRIDVGSRPYFLIDDMAPSALKNKLSKCAHPTFGIRTMHRTSFAIGHRGACLMFPEHTKESYEAAIRMGAGRVECDVAFTKDNELVCRHNMSELHTTTDILLTPLAAKCTQPFKPYNPITNTSATAECRTTDITLEEFKTLRGKMDGFNPLALTPQDYVAGTPSWRTDLYAGPTSGTLMSHKDSIALFDLHGVQMTPELKEPA